MNFENHHHLPSSELSVAKKTCLNFNAEQNDVHDFFFFKKKYRNKITTFLLLFVG